MEYCPNGSLYDLIQKEKKLDEQNAMRIFLQLITVLEYLHEGKHIVHRDLNTENIILDKNYNI
jgi:serine/threonine protein kinase